MQESELLEPKDERPQGCGHSDSSYAAARTTDMRKEPMVMKREGMHSGWSWPGHTSAGHRRHRALPARLKGQYLFRSLFRFLGHLTLGLFLVGCSTAGKSSETSLIGKITGSTNKGKSPKPKLRRNDDPFEMLVKHPEPDWHIACYRRLGDPKKVPGANPEHARLVLIKGLREEVSPLARTEAVKALSAYPSAETVQELERATRDRDSMVRAEACRSLGILQSGESCEIVGKLACTDNSVDVRIAATEALESMPQTRANDFLCDCLLDRDISVVKVASKGLEVRTGNTTLGSDHIAWTAYLEGRPLEPKRTPSSDKPVEHMVAKPAAPIAPAAAPSQGAVAASNTQPVVPAQPGDAKPEGSRFKRLMLKPVSWWKGDGEADDKPHMPETELPSIPTAAPGHTF